MNPLRVLQALTAPPARPPVTPAAITYLTTGRSRSALERRRRTNATQKGPRR